MPAASSRTIGMTASFPDNVVFDDTNLIDTSYSFRRFRSRAKDALKLGRGCRDLREFRFRSRTRRAR